jgi:hypothetical protein
MHSSKIILVAVIFLTSLTVRASDGPNAGPPDSRDVAPDLLIAEQPQAPVPSPVPFGKPGVVVRTGGEIGGGPGPVRYEPLREGEFGPAGAWWKNSEIASKLQLSDEQVRKISQTFLDHKLKLIDLQAALDKEELRLQPLLDVDQPDQSRVGTQIDAITSARGRLEKENALMMLDIRRWLSVEQWKKLKSFETVEPGPRDVFFFNGNAAPNGLGIGSKQKMFFTGPAVPPGCPGVNIQGPVPSPLPEDTPVSKAH